MLQQRKRLLILGGGYAGVRVAHDIATSAERAAFDVILISRSADHLEVPSLYEVATGYLPHESTHSSEQVGQGVSAPLTDIFSHQSVGVRIGSVQLIRLADQFVVLNDKTTLSYDYLVVALGAELATYNIPGVMEWAFSVKTLPEALRLRHHIMHCLLTQPRVTVVIIGGGATGVETASELAGLIRHVRHDRQFAATEARIVLAESSPDILRESPAPLRSQVLVRLKKLGIEVMTSRTVERLTETAVFFKDGGTLMSDATVWAGGLRPHEALVRSGLPIRGWGVAVEPTMQVVGHPALFAAGDSAVVNDPAVRIPATVPVAYAQGALVARNLRHLYRGEALESFRFSAFGQLVTVGGKMAIFISRRGRGFMGVAPWLAKRFVSLRYWLQYLPFWVALRLWYQGVWRHSFND